MNKELLELAEDTLALALKAGATSGDAMVTESRDASITMREGKVEELEQSESRAVGLRIFAGQSSATIAGSVLTKDARQKLGRARRRHGQAVPQDPFNGLADPAQLGRPIPELDLFSRHIPTAA